MKSDPVTVKSGLKQSVFILHILFNIVLEMLLRKIIIEPHDGIKLQDSVVSLLNYVDDDAVLMEESQVILLLFNRLNDAA